MKGIYSRQKLNPKIIRFMGFKEISPHFWMHKDIFTHSQEFILGRNGWQHCIFIRGDSNEDLFRSITEYISGKKDSLSTLKGRWLIVIYGESPAQDHQTEIVLISDRLGSHRIYYTYDHGLLTWSTHLSELLKIKRECDQRPRLDSSAMTAYLHFLHQPASKSLLEGVFILPPGSMLTFSEGRLVVNQFWTPKCDPLITSEKEAVSHIKNLFHEMTASEAFNPDKRAGLFLSGGLDSTLIASFGKDRGMDLTTYHVGYDGAPDERESARAVARHYKTSHKEIILKPEDMNDLLWDATRSLGFPTGNPSSIATYLVARQAKEEVRILMSGLGSDEVFAGHKKHIIVRYRPIAPTMFSFMRKWLTPFGGKDDTALIGRPGKIKRYSDFYTFFDQPQLNRLLRPKFRSTEDGFYALLHRDNFYEEQFLTDIYVWLADDLLPMISTLVTHHGLMLNLPLCQDDILEYGARIPIKMKVKGKEGKCILRKACQDLVPDWVLKQKRRGFTMPIGPWLRGPLKRLMDIYLHPDVVNRRGILNPVEVQSMVKAHLDGKADLSLQLWGLITLEVWQRIFIDPPA